MSYFGLGASSFDHIEQPLTHTHTRTYTHTYTYTHICTHIQTHTSKHAYTHSNMSTRSCTSSRCMNSTSKSALYSFIESYPSLLPLKPTHILSSLVPSSLPLCSPPHSLPSLSFVPFYSSSLPLSPPLLVVISALPPCLSLYHSLPPPHLILFFLSLSYPLPPSPLSQSLPRLMWEGT